jgi:hypothetical protein
MNDENDEIEYLTYAGALAIARSEAYRDLVAEESSIRYVAFDPNWDDYCYCEFRLEKGGWIKTVRMLQNEERLPGEEIQDARIIELARSDKRLSAIRLYRAKYQVGLAEGKAGVEALLKQG